MRRSSPWPSGSSRRHIDLKAKPLFGRRAARRPRHVCTTSSTRIVAERQRELSGLDLGQVEHVVDQAEQVPAIALHALEHARASSSGSLAIDVVEDAARCSRGWR